MSPRKILIIDDQAMVRDVCAAALKLHGFETAVAANGADGLAAYLAGREEMCLVLSDLTMPVMDGVALARALVAIDPRVKVLLMSGYDMEVAVPCDLKAVCAVIPKPFTAPVLVAAVRKCLQCDDDQTASAESSPGLSR